MKFQIVILLLIYFVIVCGSGNTLLINLFYPYENLDKNSHLFLRGDDCGLNWDSGIQMKSDPDNNLFFLSIDVDSSCSGNELQMKALVDDNDWQIGANFMVDISGIQNYKGSDSVSYSFKGYPWFYTTDGEYKYIRNVYSPQLNNTRDLVIYTPPSYNENYLKIYDNILVAHDGQNLFNASTSFLGIAWDCQDTINNLVNEGEMEEVVMIGVDNTPDRDNELTYDYDPTQHEGGKGNLYLDFIEQTVIPIVNEHYNNRLQTSKRENMGILGSSLGGLISCYAGWTRSLVYSKAFCMSSSFWWNSQSFLNNILVNFPNPLKNSSMNFYLDSGDQGDDQDDMVETQSVRDKMKSFGYVLNDDLFYYLDKGGWHNEQYWGARFWIPMTDLYPPIPKKPTSIQN
ncbi:putative conserved membrane protein [Anaeramoeba ignava]|uniref:Conserved membrane protein n=1 Tax=Anaeramoeba ignava TaxID=1746090 RepID=A0A9Q0R9J0_ANAIG|nr:putative conserved membrane protein [Anaeramoeba ignava]